MAFPSVRSRATSEESASLVGSHDVSLPATVVEGDLLLVKFSAGGGGGTATVGWPAGWTVFFTDGNGNLDVTEWAWKEADGSEGGTTITLTTSTDERSGHNSYAIQDAADPSTQPPESSAGATGDSQSPDPDSLTPTGGAKDYLWFASSAARMDHSSGVTAPTNYSNLQTVGPGVASNAVAERQLNASSEDPGTFSWSDTGNLWVAETIVVHPVENTTPATPDTPTETTGPDGEQPTSEYDVLSGPDQGSYQWTASASGTNEYYLEASGGGDPGLTEVVPDLSVYMDGIGDLGKGTLGSLADHEVGWGDNDTLGFDTLYLRDDSGDPDTTGVEILYMRATEYIEVTGIDDTLGNDLRIEYQITDHDTWGFSKTEAITGTTMTVKLEDLPADRGIDARPITVNTDEDPDVESDPGGTLTFRSAPEPPSQVTAVEGSPTDEADISWQSNSGTAYSHRVWETLVADPARLVGTQPGGTNTITDDGGGAGLADATYQYEVRSYNATDDKFSGPVVSGTVEISESGGGVGGSDSDLLITRLFVTITTSSDGVEAISISDYKDT